MVRRLDCVCPLWGWKVCPDVFILRLSAGQALTTGAAHWMTQKLPAFPADVSPKSSSCVCLCVCVYKERRRGCINIHTLTHSLKCAAKHQRLRFIAILARVCFHKNNPPILLSSLVSTGPKDQRTAVSPLLPFNDDIFMNDAQEGVDTHNTTV